MIKVKEKLPAYSHLKVAPFDSSKRYTKPHRHNKYLEIVYLSEGSGVHGIDDQLYAIEPPVFFFVRKDSVHHWAIDTPPKGYVILFRESFLDATVDKEINSLIMELTHYKHKKCSNPEFVERLFELLCMETGQSSTRGTVQEGLLKALLGHINAGVRPQPDNLAEQFLAAVEQDPRNSVAYYAEIFDVPTKRLTKACKDYFGKTPAKLIAFHIIKEAKRLLLFSDMHIAEIAYQLNFKDASHFGKYFKKQVQLTPADYRRRAKKV